MENLTTILPKLRHDTAFFQTEQGLLFVKDGKSFHVKNKVAKRWFVRFCSFLDGRHTLAELCEGFEPARLANVVTLINTLLQEGLLKNVSPEEPLPLSDAVCRRFHAQIEFISHYTDAPQHCFNTFRKSHTLLVGTGEMLFALARSLLHNGLQELTFVPIDYGHEYERRLEVEVQEMRRQDREIILSRMDYSALNDDQNLQAYDLVICCVESDRLGLTIELNARCLEAGVPFLPTVTLGEQALIGPLVHMTCGPCWLCALLRLSSNAEPIYSAALWQAALCGQDFGEASTKLFTPLARMIGNGLGFEAFKILTGIMPPETENSILVQDVETLEISRSSLSRHPLCPVCSRGKNGQTRHKLQEIVTGKREAELAPADLSEQERQLIDPHFGVYTRFADDDLTQMPLHQTKLLTGSPASPLDQRLDVRAYSMNNLREARQAALLEGIKRYARAIPLRQDIVIASSEDMKERQEQVVEAHLLSTWTGGKKIAHNMPTAWQRAFAYFTQTFCFVPAAAVYPDSRLNREGIIEKNAAGLAAGLTFHDLLSEGIPSALAFIHLRDLLMGQGSVIRLDPEGLEINDPDLLFLIASLEHMEQAYSIFEVVHSSPLHVLILSSQALPEAGAILTVGSGLTGNEALKMALLELAGRLQTFQADGEIPDTGVALFPAFSLCGEFAQSERAMSRFQEPRVTLAQIENYLRQHRYEVLFVDTTPPDIYEQATYICGSVLLARLCSETGVEL